MDFILDPWPWYVSGPLFALVMLSLTVFGKNFGMSSNLRTLCAIGGAGKWASFFKFDIKAQKWNLVVVLGAVIGGYLGSHFLQNQPDIAISASTVEALQQMGFQNPGASILPPELFSLDALAEPKTWAILIIGGFLVGFGTRYAGGCTSGHAISGLSNLQLPSLVAVIGFFIGGLIMTHLILPQLF
ncbi:MAG: YeeE/YedE family protein [Flavobacteriaceae bacterium]|nr:YeeE/YedE family protein [Flavobacteriaceae bacterium]MCO4854201.1 YeeE/YedE family protein [Flavobacteriaceae bacterium]MDA9280924.1 YeeE/YedE family protein [Flavobacteriaceae bacterium]MDA9374454.1 YeeE/YedE family protein [Flavobacteriaceae bacterium]MDC1276178.1 YeeE/YedE family protein [Flavobacteriaceae bacterium]